MADQVPEVPTPTEKKHPDGAPVLKGASGVTFWPNEAKAIEIASKRTEGARRAFKVTGPGDKVRFCTSAHGHYVMEYITETELKILVDEVGKPARASTPVTADSILAAINMLPNEAERAAVMKQLEAHLKAPKK